MKILKFIFAIISIMGVLLIIGSVGGVDLGTIGLKQMIIQILVGFIMFIGGAKLWDICV